MLPIIKPYKAESVDNADSWLLNFDGGDNLKLSAFNVSKNFIYGYGSDVDISGQSQKGWWWFAFDVRSKLFMIYRTREQLVRSLNGLNINAGKVASCQQYLDTLSAVGKLSWYPGVGKNYPVYPDVPFTNPTEITVTEKPGQSPQFDVGPVRYNENHIYNFVVKYKNRQTGLYSVEIAYHDSELLRDSLRITSFIDSNKFDVSIFTNDSIATLRKIPKNKRFLEIKSFSINK